MNQKSEKVWSLRLEEIVMDEENVRKKYDDIESMAASMKSLGQLQPIVVRAHEEDAQKFTIVAGHRRFLALQMNGAQTIQAIVRTLDERDKSAMQLVENIQRENLSALEIAEALQGMSEQGALSAETIAEQIGKEPRWIKQHLALLKVNPKILKSLKTNALGLSQAQEVVRCAKNKTIEEAIKMASDMREGKVSREQARQSNQAKAEEKPAKIFSAHGDFYQLKLSVSAELAHDETFVQEVEKKIEELKSVLQLAA